MFVAARLIGQTIQTLPPFEPNFPDTAALGNAVVASARGFESLYSNPAGFAQGKPSFTVVAAAPTLGLQPTAANFERLARAWSSPGTADSALGPLFVGGGFGFNAAVGMGYSGSGLGLGLVLGEQTSGSSPTDVRSHATLAFIGGMGIPIGKHLLVGGAVRPMFQVLVPDASMTDLLSFLRATTTSDLNTSSLYGVGVALDLGAIVNTGAVSYGVAVTDIGGTRLSFAEDTLGSLASSLGAGGGLPNGRSVSLTYMVPMRATLGVAFHPRVGRGRSFVPSIEIDYTYRFDPNEMLRLPTSTELLDGFHAGIDLGLFSLLHLRAGYEYGRVSGGVGMDLPGFHIDALAFRQVASSDISGPSRGISAGVSIRF